MYVRTDKPLSIVFITNNYFPYSGGVVSSIESFREQLQRQGHTVHIITLDFLATGSEENYVIRVPCCLRFRYRQNYMAIPWRMKHTLSTILKQLAPDLIHVHHPFLLGSAGLQIARQLNIPIIFTHHTLYEHYLHYIPFISSGITKNWLKNTLLAYVRDFCLQVDHIIAPSKTIQEYLAKRTINHATVIPSGILPIFCHTEKPIKSHNQPFRLITVSRFVKEKNIYRLLDAFSHLDQDCFTLDLCGYGAEYAALYDYAYNHLTLSADNVRFVLSATRQQLRDYYLQADLFIFASQTETQGIVCAEAMASGTPVVAFDGPGVSDIVEQGLNGFLVSTVDEMVSAINRIASDHSLHASLQHNAFETAQSYTSEQTTKNLVGLYYRILHEA